MNDLRIVIQWVGALLMVVALTACEQQRDSSSPVAFNLETAEINLDFTTAEGYTFDARIDASPIAARNGWGVLLMGGGYGNDLDWTVPGSLRIDGQETQFTITGETHRDAPLISKSLVDRGFVVMRWSTIRRDDPLKDQWPARMTTYPAKDMVEHARAALAAFRKRGLVSSDQIILLGHSLGGTRACTIAADDDSVAGLILLAPASLTREGTTGRAPTEFGMVWGEDVLVKDRIPAIVLSGEIDRAQGRHGPNLEKVVRERGLKNVEVHVMPALGHQLSREENDRLAPIDDAVLKRIAEWAQDLAHKRR